MTLDKLIKNCIGGGVILISLAAANVAQSATTSYTSSADFFNDLGTTPTVTEDYESFPLETIIPAGTTVNGITYDGFFTFDGTIEGRVTNEFNAIGTRGLSVERTGGTFPDLDFFFGDDSFDITFSNPVTAVGIFFNSNADPNSFYSISTPLGDAQTGSSVGASLDFDTFFFAGFISDTPFSSVTIGSTGFESTFDVDDLIFAPVDNPPTTPEPSAILGFLALGLLGSKLSLKHRK